jgi:uncharacterized repeat protein (TIGR03803 family)
MTDGKNVGFWLLACLGFVAVPGNPVQAGGTYTELYNFDCANDGCNPLQPALLAQGEDGVLYSTLPSGTSGSQDGTIMDYAPGGAESTLYRFQGTDGAGPESGFTLGFDGAFYGTTSIGGLYGKGTVFRLSGGSMTDLHDFTDGTDGAYPWAPPVQTPDGNIYGVTDAGTYPGTAYRIAPNGKFSAIATLPSKTIAPLVMGTDGNFYGTTQYGGDFNRGTVFRLSVKGKLKIIHSFDPSSEGGVPLGPVMIGADNKFYGTTSGGGAYSAGIVFQLSSSGAYRVLHNFQSATEGSGSAAGLVQGSDKFLYSVMSAGGTKGYGTLYRINTTGTKFQVLHQFDNQTGSYPASTPTLHTNGTLYGTTTKGGSGENGTAGVVFSFANGLKPFVSLQLWAGTAGTSVGILGQGFSAATGVEFGNVVADYTVVSDTYMIATVPPGAQTANVTVSEPGGDLVTLRKFKVIPG